MLRYAAAIAALLVLLFAAPLPAHDAGDTRTADEAAEDTVVGTWYVQRMDGEPTPDDTEVRLEFHEDGTAHYFENGEEEGGPMVGYTYSLNEADRTLQLIIPDAPEIEIIGDYAFVDDVLLIAFRVNGDEEQVMELTRSAEGSDESRDAAEAAPDTVVGTWYVQRMHDEWTPVDSEMRLEFREDGTAHFFEDGDEEEDVMGYVVDEDNGTIQIIDPDDGEVEAELAYHFMDDMLLLFISDFEEEMEIELTRSPEGNEEHQAMRAAGSIPMGERSQLQSRNQMRGLHQGLVTFSMSNKDRYPAYLGLLLPGDFVVAGYFLTPWAPVDVPEDIDDWSEDEKIEWVRTNTSYAFVRPGQVADGAPDLVSLFELPLFEGTETIGICFDDNHIERFPYDEADELIEEQTGKDMMQWMEDMGREQIPMGDDGADEIEEKDDAQGNAGGGHFHADGTYSDGRSVETEEETDEEPGDE